MPVVNVGMGVVYTTQPLSGIDSIVFSNSDSVTSAAFASHYFDNTQILDSVSITGSAGANGLTIVVGPYPIAPTNPSNAVNASGWNFVDWSADDSISFFSLGKASITATSLDDQIYVGGQSTIHAGGGDDTIGALVGAEALGGSFLDGAMVVHADGGDDTIAFQLGAGANAAGSLFDGGAGNDKAVFGLADVTSDLNINFKSSGDVGMGISIANIETLQLLSGSGNDRVTGSTGADILLGGGGNDVLRGGRGGDGLLGDAGNDRVDGGSGKDVLGGGDGRDRLEGGSGNDGLAGGNGNDTLGGGAGSDILAGEEGLDIFVFTAAADTVTGRHRDAIADFAQAGDTIDLAAIDADAGSGGDQAFAFIGTGKFTGLAGQLRYRQLADLTVLSGDTNGDGGADFEIGLAGLIALADSDFEL